MDFLKFIISNIKNPIFFMIKNWDILIGMIFYILEKNYIYLF